MIIYGSFGNVSVAALFIGGIVPGVLIGFSLMAISAYYAKKYDYPKERDTIASPHEILQVVRTGIWPIGVPILLIGGMVGGVMTPTEASLVTVVYTLAIIFLVYKTLRLRDLPHILIENALSSSIPLFCLACAGVYGYLLAFFKVPDAVGEAVIAITHNPHLIMAFIIFAFLVIGTFMDGTPTIIIMLPITQKLGQLAGINQLHLGLVVCLTTALGLLTPPYGLCTLISCAIGKTTLAETLRPMAPMFVAILLVVIAIAYAPDLALFLPRLLVPSLVPSN
jgi:tripartite ATP-independent transporter DctM subunit